MSRFQVQDLPEPERFRPVQPTGDTFGGAPKPIIDQNAERLAAALSSFGGSLSGLAKRDQRAERAASEQVMERLRQTQGDNAYNERVLSGQAPGINDPVISAGLHRQVGTNLFNEFQRTTRDQVGLGALPLTEPDGRPVDVNAIVSARYDEVMRRNAQVFGPAGSRDPRHVSALSGFNAGLDGLRTELITKQREQVLSGTNERLNNVIQGQMDRVITQAEGMQDVAQLRDLWAKTRQEVLDWATPGGPGDGRRSLLDHRRLDEQMVGRLREAATRSPEAVLRILTLDRGTSAEGVQLGSLAQARHADATQIIERANNELSSRWSTAQREQAAASALRAFQAGDGSFQQLRPIVVENPYKRTEGPLTITVEEQQQAALQRHEAAIGAQLRREGASAPVAEETLWRQQATGYIGNNIAQPQWRDALNVYGRVMSNAVNVSTPEGADSVSRAADLYQRIQRENPGYAEHTLGVTPDAQRFYDRIRTYRDFHGYDAATAVRMAADSVRSPQSSPGREERDTLRSEAARIGTTMFGWMGGGVNRRAAERAIEQVAETLMTRDIDAKTAIQSAARIVNERAGVVNGHLILGSTYIHRGTQAVAARRLADIQQQYAGRLTGLDGIYTGKLTLVPDGNQSSFRVVQAEGRNVGEPVITTDANGRPQMLRVLGREITDMQRQQQAAEQGQADAARVDRQQLERDRAIANGPTSGRMERTLPPGSTGAQLVEEAQRDAARRLAGRRASSELREEDPSQRGEVIRPLPEAEREAARERLAADRERRGSEAEAGDPDFIRRIRGERRPAANPAVEQDTALPRETGDPLAPIKGLGEWLRRNGGAQRRTD